MVFWISKNLRNRSHRMPHLIHSMPVEILLHQDHLTNRENERMRMRMRNLNDTEDLSMKTKERDGRMDDG